MWFKSECSQISEQLWEYVSQRLSGAETTRVETHLQQCARCQTEAEAYRQTVGMLGAARQLPIPASQTTWRDLRPSLDPVRRPVLRSTDFLPRLTLAAAGTALGATLLVVFFSGGRSALHPGNTVVRAHEPLATAVPQTAPRSTEVAQNSSEAVEAPHGASGFAFGSFFNPAPSVLQTQNSAELSHATPLPRAPVVRRHNGSRSAQVASNNGHLHAVANSEDAEAQLDGGNVSPRAQHNYVLNPVSASSEDDTTRHYVISSIPATQNGSSAIASNDGNDEGRAW